MALGMDSGMDHESDEMGLPRNWAGRGFCRPCKWICLSSDARKCHFNPKIWLYKWYLVYACIYLSPWIPVNPFGRTIPQSSTTKPWHKLNKLVTSLKLPSPLLLPTSPALQIFSSSAQRRNTTTLQSMVHFSYHMFLSWQTFRIAKSLTASLVSRKLHRSLAANLNGAACEEKSPNY